MEKVNINPAKLKNKMVLDIDGQEVGHVREIEQELRTGRYSTLRVEVNPKHTQKMEFVGSYHMPLDTNDIDLNKDTIKLRNSIDDLNRQFHSIVKVNGKQCTPNDFVEKPVFDKNSVRIGTVKDYRTTTNKGEFSTLLIELQSNIREKHTSDQIDDVRVRTDSIEDVGSEIRLSKNVDELSREWNEIIVRH